MIWSKDKIATLNDLDKDQWFDVYNNGLLEDRDYDIDKLSKIEISRISKNIKNDYLNYLNNQVKNKDFMFYSVIKNEDVLVAVCRLVKSQNEYYIEGLETHRDFRKQGFGLTVLKEVLKHSKTLEINIIYSTIRLRNKASINTHIKCGFVVYSRDSINVIMRYDSNDKQKYYLEFESLNHENKSFLEVLKKDDSISKYIHVSDNYFDYLVTTKNVLYLFIKIEGKLVGSIHIEKLNDTATFSIEILSSFQRMGVASKVLDMLKIDYFQLGVHKYKVTIEKQNSGSISLFEKSGFTYSGDEDNLQVYTFMCR